MSSIPYSPSLVLGQVVDPNVIAAQVALAALQKNVDNAKDKLNRLILSRRQLDFTIMELENLGIDPGDVTQKRTEINGTLVGAAQEWVKAVTDFEAKDIPVSGGDVNTAPESPVDFVNTQLKTLPLAADTMKLDCQYFSNASMAQGASNTIKQIATYVSDSVSVLGDKFSATAAASAQSQATSQYTNHLVDGTLVIVCTCTHKNVLLMEPLVIDPDKAIAAWNALSKDPINIDIADTGKAFTDLQNIANTPDKPDAETITVLSGVSYGSSFVGMVHVLRRKITTTAQEVNSAAAQLQASFDVNEWIMSESGSFGVASQFTNDVKSLLSNQQITSHCSLIVMGTLPSIKSNDIKVAVKEFANFDPDQMMSKLAVLNNSTSKNLSSLSAGADSARTGQKMQSLLDGNVSSVMAGLAESDAEQNKMIDINTLMTAFEDYVNKCIAGDIGVPINYYTKRLTKRAIAKAYMQKYYPQYLPTPAPSRPSDNPTPAPAPQPQVLMLNAQARNVASAQRKIAAAQQARAASGLAQPNANGVNGANGANGVNDANGVNGANGANGTLNGDAHSDATKSKLSSISGLISTFNGDATKPKPQHHHYQQS